MVDKYLIKKESLTSLADEIRVLSDTTDLMSIDDMISKVKAACGKEPILQEKTVSPTTSAQTITADDGYDGLDTVTVNAIQTETKTVTPSTSQQSVTPSSGKYLSQVTVGAIPSTYIQPSGTLSITENGTYDVTNYASAEVNVAGSGDSYLDSEGVYY